MNIGNDKNQLLIVDQVDGQEKLIHLGGCSNRTAAQGIVNQAFEGRKVVNPQYILLVPARSIFKCETLTKLKLAELIPAEPSASSAANAPASA